MPGPLRSLRRLPVYVTALLFAAALCVSLLQIPASAAGASQGTSPGFHSGGWGGETFKPAPATAGRDAASGQVIVVLSRDAQASALSKVADKAKARLESVHSARSSKSLPFAIYSSTESSTEELVEYFQGQPGVLAVSANYTRTLCGVPNDPLFADLWGLENTGQTDGTADADIDASAAWDITTGSGAVVAVIDTGVDYTHEDLAGNMWVNSGEIDGNGIDDDANGYIDDIYGIDAYEGDADPMDDYGHGTHASGTIAAVGNNSTGVIGVAYGAKIMALRAGGSSGLSDADAIECIDYAIDMKLNHGVNIVAINASWGSYSYGSALELAVQAAGEAGIVFVAAAGNDETDIDSSPFYPAALDSPYLISTGASDAFDNPADFSNFGETSVDLFAPGVDILSTYPAGTGVYWSAAGDPFFDDMESGTDLWAATGTWALTTAAYASPTHSWTDSPSADYANSTDTSLTTVTQDLSSLASEDRVCLGFQVLLDLVDGDYLYVEVSGDAGSSWTELEAFTDFEASGGYWYGDLPSGVLTSLFQLRFRLVTDASSTADGVYIDDVGIGVPGAYDYMSGTSMAAPHVAGAVALVAAVAPSEAATARVARILASADTASGLSGKCQTGGRLNAAAAVATSAPTPTITGLSPASGTPAGGTTVALTGTGFYGVTAVTFGGTDANSFTVVSPTQITAVSPAHDAGTVQVQVAAGDSSTIDVGADDYTYGLAPTIAGIVPDAGPTSGGTSVVITGTGFVDVTGVTFGETPAASYVVDSTTQITATSPAHDAGTVQVAVATSGLDSADTAADDFTFEAPFDPGANHTERVNVTSDEAQTGTGQYLSDFACSASADGRYIAFSSRVNTLVSGDTAYEDIFVRDRYAGTTERVSVTAEGDQANGSSSDPAISADGRYVAFVSSASNLVPGDDSGADVFVHDMVTGANVRLGEASYYYSSISLSADGRYVAFVSDSSTLVPGDTNGCEDIFVYDMQAATNTRVSVGTGGSQSDSGSSNPSVSADGRYVAFESSASNLVAGDTNNRRDAFVHDTVTGTTTRVSVSSDGTQMVGSSSGDPSISADGRWVAFQSQGRYQFEDTNMMWDIFVHDRQTGATTRVSVSSEGEQAVGDQYDLGSRWPSISADGRYVAFMSVAENLVPDDTNGDADVFVYDRQTGACSRVSLDSQGGQADHPASADSVDSNPSGLCMSGDGHSIVFVSKASDLVPEDTNNSADLFVAVREWATKLDSLSPSIVGGDGTTSVDIMGWDFNKVTAVTFAGELASDFVIESQNHIIVTAPYRLASGEALVQVTGAYGTTADEPEAYVTYVAPPVVTELSQTTGSVVGGTTVIISGTNFDEVSGLGGVTFGGKNAWEYSVDSESQITAVSPSHTEGPVEVVVHSGFQTSVASENDQFTYVSDARLVERISGDQTGFEGDDDSGLGHVTVSADGRYVAFDSYASNLVPDDTNDCSDIFVYDRQEGTYQRVSVSTDGEEGNGDSIWGSISADGSTVAFMTMADNLSSTYGTWSVYVCDLETGETARVHAAFPLGSKDYYYPSLSADGRLVCYTASWTYTPSSTGPTYSGVDVFVEDVHSSPFGYCLTHSANNNSYMCTLDADGRYAYFETYATNLGPTDTNGKLDIYACDLQTNGFSRVSYTNSWGQPNGDCLNPSVSADGRFVAFESDASNLVTGDTNGCSDIFVRDRAGFTTKRMSVSTSGVQANDDSYYPTISSDGSQVSFDSYATNLVDGDTIGFCDVFVHGRVSGITQRVNVASDGAEANDESGFAFISGNGGWAAFVSAADNLTIGDSGLNDDVFVADVLGPPAVTSLSVHQDAWYGGAEVIITGTDFVEVTGVTFGGTPAASYTVDSYTQITATAPAHSAGVVQVQVTAAGGSSANTAGDDFTYIGSTRYQQTDSRITYLGDWTTTSTWSASGGSFASTDQPGAAIMIEFDGTAVELALRITSWYGKAKVTLDAGTAEEQVDVIDLYSPATAWKVTSLYSKIGLDPGAHTLLIEHTGEKNASSSGTSICLDAADITGTLQQADIRTRYEQTCEYFNYQGPWLENYPSPYAASGWSYAKTSGIGASMSMTFEGVYLEWVTRVTPWYGIATVVLDAGTPDEEVTEVDLWSATDKHQQKVYNTGLLEDGTHTLHIYCTGDKNPASWYHEMCIDAFDILGTVPAVLADPAPSIALKYQQDDARLTYLGEWFTGTSSSASGGSYAFTTQEGALVMAEFSGTEVTTVFRIGPTYGEAKVTLDPGTPGEQVDTVDLYNPTIGWRVDTLYAKTGLADTEHTLAIENASTSGEAISLDALKTWGDLEQASAATKIDDNDVTFFTYDPAWSRWDNSGYWAAYLDTYAFTDKDEDKCSFTFEGTFASWLACTSNTKGKATVSLYNGSVGPGNLVSTTTVDLYSPSTLWKRPVYCTGLLEDSTHIVVIECLYEKNAASWWYTVDVDRFDIFGTFAP